MQPVIAGGLAMVAGDDQKVHAVDLKSHKEAWVSDDFKGGLSALKAVGGIVLAHTGASLVGLDAATGKKAWSLELPQPAVRFAMVMVINGRVVSSGSACELGVEDGVAYVLSSQSLWAVDVKTGQKQWELATANQNGAGNPGGGMVMGPGGGRVIINGNGRMVINGMPFGGGMGGGVTAPVVAGGAVYYGAADGLHAVSIASHQEAWVLQTAAAVCCRPVVCDGVIYFGLGKAQPGVDAPKGEKLPAVAALKPPK